MNSVTVTVTMQATFSLPSTDLKPDDTSAQDANLENLEHDLSVELAKLGIAGKNGHMNMSVSVQVKSTSNPPVTAAQILESESAEALTCNGAPLYSGLHHGVSAVIEHEADS